MHRLKIIANVTILSPLALLVYLALFLCYVFFFGKGLSDEQVWRVAFAFAISYGFILLGVAILFPVGILLQGFIAARTEQKTTWAWWVMLLFSTLLVIQQQWGLRVEGICIMVSLLTLKPFRILRRGVYVPLPAMPDTDWYLQNDLNSASDHKNK